MHLSKTLLSVLPAASKDETRTHLNVVRIEAAECGSVRTVATNGHWLLAATDKGQPSNGASGSLPRDAAERIAKLLGKQDAAPLSREGDAYTAELPGGIKFQAAATESEFPNWQACRPSGEPAATISVDAKYLEAICRAALAFAKAQNADAFMTLEIRDTADPVALKVSGKNGGELYGLLMPVRL
jgi:DNA polymerase III sliding clamp (beta) subunit (PCNA family)